MGVVDGGGMAARGLAGGLARVEVNVADHAALSGAEHPRGRIVVNGGGLGHARDREVVLVATRSVVAAVGHRVGLVAEGIHHAEGAGVSEPGAADGNLEAHPRDAARGGDERVVGAVRRLR